MSCPLCDPQGALDGGVALVRTPRFRLLRVRDEAFPAYYRLIWNDHVPEWSDLAREHRIECLDALHTIESALRAWLKPHKVNLASLGNQVPHLHWHVIGRYDWDSHFPAAIWAPPARPVDAARLQALQDALLRCDHALQRAFGGDATSLATDAPESRH